jgi:hypothetical protein
MVPVGTAQLGWIVTLAVGAGTVNAGVTTKVAGSDTQVGSLMNLTVRL